MFIVVAMLAMAPLELPARTLGMVVDNVTFSVTVFDADTHAVLGTVPIIPSDPLFSVIGDVVMTPDLKRGFVTNRDNQVSVIDLTTSPPSLAGSRLMLRLSTKGIGIPFAPSVAAITLVVK